MKRIVALLLLLLLPLDVLAEGPIIVRLTDLTEECVFPPDTPILEVVFPRVLASDCAIVRFGHEVLLIDASTGDDRMHKRISTALLSMGVQAIDAVFNSHPHPDHIGGVIPLNESIPVGELLLTYPPDATVSSLLAVVSCNAYDVPVHQLHDGDVLTLGLQDEVTLRVIQNDRPDWRENDRSAMLLLTYGERTLLFAADIEDPAQTYYGREMADGSLQADILKYPHHGLAKMKPAFLQAVDPEFVLLTGASGRMDEARADLRQRGIDYVVAYKGLTRMRSDGHVWVIDYMHERATDCETINPLYRRSVPVYP